MHIKEMWYDNEKSVTYFIVDTFEISDDFIEYKKDLIIDKSTISKAKKITRLNFESILYQYKQIQQIKY